MIDALARILAPIDRLVAALLRWLVILALAGVLVLIALGILARSLPVFTMSGYDEVIELLVAWMTFAGGVALWREGTLFRVDLAGLLPWPALTIALDLLVRLLMLTFALVFTYEGWIFTAQSIETMPFLLVSKQPWYAAMPVSGALMTAYAVAALLRPRRQPVPETAPVAVPASVDLAPPPPARKAA